MSSKRLDTGRFLGVTETLFSENGIVVSEIVHGRARELPLHVHQSAYYSLLLSGGYEEERGRDRLTYRPGSIGFHPRLHEHRDRIGAEGGRFLAIELAPSWMDRVREFGPVAGEAALQPPEASWIARRILHESRGGLPARRLAIEGLVLELLVDTVRRMPRADTHRPRWLDRVLARLEDEPFRCWSAAALAAEALVHPVHLARTFRRFQGCSLGAAARAAQVRAAVRLLDDGGMSLADVAAAAGYADQSHFTRRFRRATGMTPGEYRRGGVGRGGTGFLDSGAAGVR